MQVLELTNKLTAYIIIHNSYREAACKCIAYIDTVFSLYRILHKLLQACFSVESFKMFIVLKKQLTVSVDDLASLHT